MKSSSRALILDPTYGEYAHVLETVIGCTVDRFPVFLEEGYELNSEKIIKMINRNNYDLVIIVNPNSPTGIHTDKNDMLSIIKSTNEHTRFWIDETYIEYAGSNMTLEPFVEKYKNMIICKSMSKVYALSGARAAYLAANSQFISNVLPFSPPWVVSLPGQIAAVKALEDPDYYTSRYAQTHENRKQLANMIAGNTNFIIHQGITNCILCTIPEDGPTAEELTLNLRQQNLFIRDAKLMGKNMGNHTIRIAVKDSTTNSRMSDIIANVCSSRNRKETAAR